MLLDDDAYSVGEAHRIVWSIRWQQKHFDFVDVAVFEIAIIDGLQEHAAFVLVEPFWRFVDVIICSGVGTSDNLFNLSGSLPE